MKSEITLYLRQFPVLAHDHRDGQEEQAKYDYLYGAGGGEAGA